MNCHDRPDHDLLLACRSGDDDAARLFYARMAPILNGFARRVLHDRALAEDAVQAAMMSIYRLPKRKLREVRDVRAWLIRIVRNESLMLLRTDRRAAAREEQHARNALQQLRYDTPDFETLRHAVDALPVKLREIIVLKCVSGLTFEQIADALEENRNTIASRYRNALVKLREVLGESPDPDDDITALRGARERGRVQ